MLMENIPQMIVGSLYVVYVQDKGLSSSIYFAFANNIAGLIVKIWQVYTARNSDAPDPKAVPEVELHEVLNPTNNTEAAFTLEDGSKSTQVMVLGNDGVMRKSTGFSTTIGSSNTKVYKLSGDGTVAAGSEAATKTTKSLFLEAAGEISSLGTSVAFRR